MKVKSALNYRPEGHRPDIDGLRCIAVSSVFLYHLNNNILPGGFTGVDIFFVISGFLISRIIVTEVSNGSFSIAHFYARRVRRIFPALFAMLLVSSIMAVIAFPPDLYSRFFTEFRFSALQISNFLFAQEKGYFEPANEYSLLLHTWSLGVEEQFYLIWPFLIIGVARFCKKAFLPVLSLVTLASLLLSDYLSISDAQAAFYMLPSRTWELGIGALTVLVARKQIRSAAMVNVLAIAGALLVAMPMFALNGADHFPGRNALPTVLGTAILLYTGGCRSNSFPGSILSLAPITGIGLISYSLYLWHWPLIVFHRVTAGREISLASGAAIIAVALGCSLLSYFLVERPCRYGSVTKPYRRLLPLVKTVRRRVKVFAYVSLLLVIPLAVMSLFLMSTQIEANRAVTSLTLDVDVLSSKRPIDKEVIALYWGNRNGEFLEENSRKKSYMFDGRRVGELYRFSFEIPELRRLTRLRLDPLHGEGVVRITNITVKGGLFNTGFVLDTRELRSERIVQSMHNLEIAIPESGGAILTSTGKDPHMDLPAAGRDNPHEKLLIFTAVSMICLLLVITLHLVDRKKEDHVVIASAGMVTLLALLISVRLLHSNHAEWRFLDPEAVEQQFVQVPLTRIGSLEKPRNPDVLLIGDSHTANYADLVLDWAEHCGLSVRVQAQKACPPIFFGTPRKEEKAILKDAFHTCSDKHNLVYQEALNNPATRYIFLAIRWEFYLANPYVLLKKDGAGAASRVLSPLDTLENALRNTIRPFIENGSEVVLLDQVPILRESPNTCMMRESTLFPSLSDINSSCDIDEKFSEQKLRLGRAMLQKVAAESPVVHYFNPGAAISSIFTDSQQVLYFDDNHLNHLGSIAISRLMEDNLANILAHGAAKASGLYGIKTSTHTAILQQGAGHPHL